MKMNYLNALILLFTFFVIIYIIYSIYSKKQLYQLQYNKTNDKETCEEGFLNDKDSEVKSVSYNTTGSGISNYNGETLYPLKEYIIKSSYNSAVSGDYVSTDMIRYVLSRGCRFLDFEVVILDNNVPYVAITSDKNYEIIDTSNKLLLDNALGSVVSYGFAPPAPCPKDPIFVHIRLKCKDEDLPKALRAVAKSVDYGLKNRLYPGKITNKTTLNEIMGQVVLIFDNTVHTNYIEKGKCSTNEANCYDISKQVNINNGPLLQKMKFLEFSEGNGYINKPKLTNDNNETNVEQMVICVPEYYSKNIDGASYFTSNYVENVNILNYIDKYGVQMLCYRYYQRDEKLNDCEDFFKHHQSAIVPMYIALSYIKRLTE